MSNIEFFLMVFNHYENLFLFHFHRIFIKLVWVYHHELIQHQDLFI